VTAEVSRRKKIEQRAVESEGATRGPVGDPHTCGSAGRTAEAEPPGGDVALTGFLVVEIKIRDNRDCRAMQQTSSSDDKQSLIRQLKAY
jgi:hypothetical protein